MAVNAPIRIGTRGSPLALVQAGMVADALRAAEPALREPEAIEIVAITTTGDRVRDRPLADIGGKGLFCKEIEQALLTRQIDIAQHCIKDMPTWLPDGLTLGAVMERADPRDVLISYKADGLASLPRGAVVGTASLRRQAQLLVSRPDLKVVSFRGNVGTRLKKLQEGEVDATLLAQAGLDRLGLVEVPQFPLSPEEMLPAVGQGAIGLECRADDASILQLIKAVEHVPTSRCILAERAMLDVLDGNCHTPIGAFAEIRQGRLQLRGLVAAADGSLCLRSAAEGPPEDAVAIGKEAGARLLASGAKRLIGP